MKQETLLQAIMDYRSDGKQLMIKLGEKYGLDISIEKEYDQLISKSNSSIPRKGELSNRWNYSFHGTACGFYNKKYQQSVEVVLSNPPEFGHIDEWFLMQYMESTNKYKEEVQNIDWLELKPMVNELYRSGKIINVE